MTETDESAVVRLTEVLAGGDLPGLVAILAGAVQLRALLPRRYVELAGSAAVAEEMLGWFAEVPRIVPAPPRVARVGDLWHAAYRFTLLGIGPERVVEQQAYCTVEDGSITAIRLVCSGFRPAASVEPAVGTAEPAELAGPAEPAADRRIDALGDGCATLTPRIAAALRELAPGQVLAVLTDDVSAPEGIAAWSRLTGHQIVATAAEPAGTRYYLRRS